MLYNHHFYPFPNSFLSVILTLGILVCFFFFFVSGPWNHGLEVLVKQMTQRHALIPLYRIVCLLQFLLKACDLCHYRSFMCLYQMMPGWSLPSRSSFPSWRRLSSKCKEGLGFGVCFHHRSACSQSKHLHRSLPANRWKLVVQQPHSVLMWTDGVSGVGGAVRPKEWKDWDSAQPPPMLDGRQQKAWKGKDPPLGPLTQ